MSLRPSYGLLAIAFDCALFAFSRIFRRSETRRCEY
jgi:hypothetical protein